MNKMKPGSTPNLSHVGLFVHDLDCMAQFRCVA
jgi:hypothetical protein